MNRTIPHLQLVEQNFIDLAYVKKIPFREISSLVKVDRKFISQLNKDLEGTWRPITTLVNKWGLKKIGGNFWDFYHWHTLTPKSCFYCNITELEIKGLYSLGIINKRATRGKTLEIDRRISSSKYNDINNLIYSCYWCNNAKTDTFSESEAKIIGIAISTIWKNRLKNFNPENLKNI